ncbi:MAG: DpnD/PcfM family protein [Clostridia bacterium]|nr:DpnD/PcfM family protein [Clostridia bacterium]
MSKSFEVNIKETLETQVTVQAESREEAERIVEQRWKFGEYVLDADHFTGVEFNAKKARDRSRDEGR